MSLRGSVLGSDYIRVAPGELFAGKRREEFPQQVDIKEWERIMDLVRIIYGGETEYYGSAAGKNKSWFASNPSILS